MRTVGQILYREKGFSVQRRQKLYAAVQGFEAHPARRCVVAGSHHNGAGPTIALSATFLGSCSVLDFPEPLQYGLGDRRIANLYDAPSEKELDLSGVLEHRWKLSVVCLESLTFRLARQMTLFRRVRRIA